MEKCNHNEAEIVDQDSDYGCQAVELECKYCGEFVDRKNYKIVNIDTSDANIALIVDLSVKLKNEKYLSADEVNDDIEKIIELCTQESQGA